jgi:hypothetical protein
MYEKPKKSPVPSKKAAGEAPEEEDVRQFVTFYFGPLVSPYLTPTFAREAPI